MELRNNIEVEGILWILWLLATQNVGSEPTVSVSPKHLLEWGIAGTSPGLKK
jgi:hypothetical protein